MQNASQSDSPRQVKAKISTDGARIYIRSISGDGLGPILSNEDACRIGRGGWSAPLTPLSLYYVVSTLRSNGVEVVGPPDVLELYKEGQGILRQIKAAKSKEGLRIPEAPVEPWEHQVIGYNTALSGVALIHMGVATGKTATCCWALRDLGVERALITCSVPAIDDVWMSQGPKWWPEAHWLGLTNEKSVSKRTKEARGFYDSKNPAIIVINRQSVWRGDFGRFVLGRDWDAIVIDEAHTAKAPGGKFSRFMAKARDRARCRLAFTGTALPKGAEDAYGVYRFLDPGIFGESYTRFEDKYCKTRSLPGNASVSVIYGYKNQEEFRTRFSSIEYHCPKSRLDLPPKLMVVQPVALRGKAARLYEELALELVTEIEEGIMLIADHAATKFMKLLQICGGTLIDEDGRAHTVGDEKLKSLEGIVESCGSDPFVIYARFTHEIHNIRKLLDKLSVSNSELSGASNDLASWKRGESQALVVQVQAGEDSIDLTRAHALIFYSRGMGLAAREQNIGRIERPNHEFAETGEHVRIIDIVAKGTVDERQMAAFEDGKDTLSELLKRPKDMLF